MRSGTKESADMSAAFEFRKRPVSSLACIVRLHSVEQSSTENDLATIQDADDFVSWRAISLDFEQF